MHGLIAHSWNRWIAPLEGNWFGSAVCVSLLPLEENDTVHCRNQRVWILREIWGIRRKGKTQLLNLFSPLDFVTSVHFLVNGRYIYLFRSLYSLILYKPIGSNHFLLDLLTTYRHISAGSSIYLKASGVVLSSSCWVHLYLTYKGQGILIYDVWTKPPMSNLNDRHSTEEVVYNTTYLPLIMQPRRAPSQTAWHPFTPWYPNASDDGRAGQRQACDLNSSQGCKRAYERSYTSDPPPHTVDWILGHFFTVCYQNWQLELWK